MHYKGIIFDFNGTLFWDSDKHTVAWKTMAAKLRREALTDEEMVQKLQGRPNPAIIEYLSGKRLDDANIFAISMEKEQIYRQLCHDDPHGCRLAPGASELLDFLKKHNIPRTIATSSERTNLDFYLETFKLAQWFDPNRIVYDDGSIVAGKPAPDIYFKAADWLHLKPQDCIVVEDSLAGIRSAYRAGIGYIVAIGPEEKRAELTGIPEKNIVISDFSELDRKILLPNAVHGS
ncbi:MAG TPA: HAD family phosphatase [Bacillota bacterium]|nr:HAD family phosphatase [Bacillota bacterium]